jgi:hypothetical protein
MIIKNKELYTCKVKEHDINTTIDCNDDVFVLDAAEEQGVEYLIHVVQVHVSVVQVKVTEEIFLNTDDQ